MSLAERLLLARLRERDEDAFSEIVRQYQDRVFNLVLRMVGNPSEAEDIAQEVFVTVFKSIESFRGEAKFSTWLLRIAANHAKNRIKYLSRRTSDDRDVDNLASETAASNGDFHARVANPDAALETAELGGRLERALETLDADQRLLVILRDVEELSYEEIGDVTGVPEGTIKSRLHRARMALKSHLERSEKMAR
jgi:RNA polymerase sigma-70 factor (ECF subfamily)